MKGVLTEEEGKLINKGHTSKTKVAPVVKEKDGAFILESANEANSISLTGRMHLDYRASSLDGADLGGRSDDRDTASLADQFELRRARLGVKGKFAKDFKYEVVANLPGTATVDVAYADWAKYDHFQIRAGKFKQPFGLEELISSNNITMMERSYLDQTVPAKKIGIQVMGSPAKGLTYALSGFQYNDTARDIYGDGIMSAAGRTTFNFAESMGDKESVMHLGVSGLSGQYSISGASSSQTDAAASFETRGTMSSFRSAGRGLTNIFRGQVGTGNCAAASISCGSEYGGKVEQRAFGLEGIFARGPFKVMGEYSGGEFQGESYNSNVSYDTKTFYLESGYFITGEKYADSYKGGVFGSFKPKNNFDIDNNNWGAVELAFRVEGYSVDNTDISGSLGRVQGNLSSYGTGSSASRASTANGTKSGANTYTAGVRWILNPNLVFKANYAYTKLDYGYRPLDVAANTALNDIQGESLFMTRLQYMF
jgi:phosphate-selective porin OprO/OprP